MKLSNNIPLRRLIFLDEENHTFIKTWKSMPCSSISPKLFLGLSRIFWNGPKKTFHYRIPHFEPCSNRLFAFKIIWKGPKFFWNYRRTRHYCIYICKYLSSITLPISTKKWTIAIWRYEIIMHMSQSVAFCIEN